MLELSASLVTVRALEPRQRTKPDRVLEASVLHGDLRFTLRLIENGMAYITFGSDDLPGVADVLAIMTSEAAQVVKMADVVGVSPPVNFHLREHVCLEDPLQL